MKQIKKMALICAAALAITSCGTPGASSNTASAPPVESSTAFAPVENSSAPAPVENDVTMEKQTLGLAKVANARDLGGYLTTTGMRVKTGKLFRTGKLDTATPEDLAKLAELGLHTVIDLRTSVEVEQEPDPVLPDVNQVHLGIYDETKESLSTPKGVNANTNYGQMVLDLYEQGHLAPDMYTKNLEDPVVQANFAKFLRLVAEESAKDGAVLYHCTSGKDRVGIGSMLILSVLEVDRETILKDFDLSNDFHRDAINYIQSEVKKITDDPAAIEGVAGLAGVVRTNMENTMNYLDETYGSPLQYITDVLGITQAEIDTMRENLLEIAG